MSSEVVDERAAAKGAPKFLFAFLFFLAAVGVAGIFLLLHARSLRAQRGVATVEIVDNRPGAQAVDIETSPDDTGLPVLFTAPTFALVNQDGEAVNNQTLAGRPYVAAFMFTNCTTACPMMAGKLFSLQKEIRSKAVRLVSFTVDPERDTPEVLRGYLTKFQAEKDRWLFLTGTKEQMVEAEKGFHLRLPRPDPNAVPNNSADPMVAMPHSDRFLLIDQKGRVRGIYDSKDETALAKLKQHSELLATVGTK